MDRLEEYLDQVCRSMGGPRSLRQHVRQELREHLLDAVARHRGAGLSEGEALERALAEFGNPEEVRSDLEATHGQRLLAVVIDRALEWKERTMRARWLWTLWAHLALAGVIALAGGWILFASVFLVPKHQRLMADGIIDPVTVNEQGIGWMPEFLEELSEMEGHLPWLLLLVVAAWVLFEWRVRSENRTLMRLSALGTVAVVLMVVSVLTAGALVVPYMVAAPETGRLARLFALEQVARIDLSVTATEQATARKDWEAAQTHTDRATEALDNLVKIAPAIAALTGNRFPRKVEGLRAQAQEAREDLAKARQAIQGKDPERVEAMLQEFRQAFAPVREEASRRPVPRP